MLWLAWVDEHDVVFDPAEHCREDFSVLSLRLSESVGIAPTFTAEIPNPGVWGLLTQSQRYAILSEQLPTDAEPIELARGVVMSVPSELATETVTLEFRCQPPDADEVHKAAADALRIGEVPYDPFAPPEERDEAESYDPVFAGQDADQDPSTALEGRYEEWFWDRKTLTVGRTHILAGSRTVDIGAAALEGSLSMQPLNAPSKVMRLRIIAHWTQSATGSQTFPVGITMQTISTYTPEDFVSQFPKPGAAIGAGTGWSLAEAELKPLGAALLKYEAPATVEGKYPEGTTLIFQAQQFEMKLRAAFDYQQAREEILDLTLPLAVYDILRDDRTETVDVIELNNLTVDNFTPEWEYEDPETLEQRHYLVGDEVQANGLTWRCLLEHDATEGFVAQVVSGSTVIKLWESIPRKAAVVDLRAPEYFGEDRGIRSMMHAARRLARKAMLRARCLELSFEVAWPVARDLSLDDSVRLEYRHLPGGEATGKLVSIELSATENGTRIARLTVAVAHGLGTPAPTPGEDQYVTDDGQVVFSVSGPPPVIPVNAYGLSSAPPLLYDIADAAVDQEAAMLGQDDPETALAAHPTIVSLGYPSLREEDLLPRRIHMICEPLAIPKGINLEPVEA